MTGPTCEHTYADRLDGLCEHDDTPAGELPGQLAMTDEGDVS